MQLIAGKYKKKWLTFLEGDLVFWKSVTIIDIVMQWSSSNRSRPERILSSQFIIRQRLHINSPLRVLVLAQKENELSWAIKTDQVSPSGADSTRHVPSELKSINKWWFILFQIRFDSPPTYPQRKPRLSLKENNFLSRSVSRQKAAYWRWWNTQW